MVPQKKAPRIPEPPLYQDNWEGEDLWNLQQPPDGSAPSVHHMDGKGIWNLFGMEEDQRNREGSNRGSDVRPPYPNLVGKLARGAPPPPYLSTQPPSLPSSPSCMSMRGAITSLLVEKLIYGTVRPCRYFTRRPARPMDSEQNRKGDAEWVMPGFARRPRQKTDAYAPGRSDLLRGNG